MTRSTKFLALTLQLVLVAATSGQLTISSSGVPDGDSAMAKRELFAGVVDRLKEAERALYLYERIERVEVRKQAGDPDPVNVRVSRVVPAGTGIAKLTLSPDEKPASADGYRYELDKLVKSLAWAAENGQPQREAYQKVHKKQKERDDLIDSTRNAFLFTLIGQEPRGERMLAKYRMEPNPAFKATNRATSIFAKVKGFVWIDETSHQMARVEGETTDDISLGIFVAKVYKGSRFMQDRYEIMPGLWLPTFSQYDFDGRKFFSSFGVHEKTYYSAYKRIGPPAEALPVIQAELNKLDPAKNRTSAER